MFTVSMFGRFQIVNEKNSLNTDSMHSDMMVKLLSYILMNRERSLTVEEITETLWQDTEADNPLGALKNLMYRLRTTMKKVFGEGDYILTGHGSYSWNQSYPVTLDTEVFEKLCEHMTNDRISPDKAINYGEQAIRLFQGDFLSRYTSQHWVVPLSAYYHSMYLSTVKKLAALYIETKQFEKMEKICIDALNYENADEELHCLLIQSMISQNKPEQAKRYYERAEKILYTTLGIRKSEQLRTVFGQLATMNKDSKAEKIEEVHHEINEDNCPDGAYICGYPIFREIYRLEARRIARLGLSEYVLLMTVNMAHNIDISDNDQLAHYQIDRTMQSLEEVLKESLRVGDVAARYSDSQYVVLLPTLNYEESLKVTNRIKNNLYRRVKSNKVHIESDLSELNYTPVQGSMFRG